MSPMEGPAPAAPHPPPAHADIGSSRSSGGGERSGVGRGAIYSHGRRPLVARGCGLAALVALLRLGGLSQRRRRGGLDLLALELPGTGRSAQRDQRQSKKKKKVGRSTCGEREDAAAPSSRLLAADPRAALRFLHQRAAAASKFEADRREADAEDGMRDAERSQRSRREDGEIDWTRGSDEERRCNGQSVAVVGNEVTKHARSIASCC